MKFFLDTADVNEIKELAQTGMVNGVTTNPTLIMKSGRPLKTVIKEICDIVPGPVSAEVIATAYEDMVQEGKDLAKIAANVVVKLPLTVDGLRACKQLSGNGIPTNVTLCFSPLQALLAAKAGASFVSPFIGRLDDISQDGLTLIHDILTIFAQYPALTTEVLVASVRHPIHVLEAAKMGAHAVTVPPKVLRQFYEHPLTDSGLKQFLADWQKAAGV